MRRGLTESAPKPNERISCWTLQHAAQQAADLVASKLVAAKKRLPSRTEKLVPDYTVKLKPTAVAMEAKFSKKLRAWRVIYAQHVPALFRAFVHQ